MDVTKPNELKETNDEESSLGKGCLSLNFKIIANKWYKCTCLLYVINQYNKSNVEATHPAALPQLLKLIIDKEGILKFYVMTGRVSILDQSWTLDLNCIDMDMLVTEE